MPVEVGEIEPRVAEIWKMKKKVVDNELKTLSLPTTGTDEDKRQRLIDHFNETQSRRSQPWSPTAASIPAVAEQEDKEQQPEAAEAAEAMPEEFRTTFEAAREDPPPKYASEFEVERDIEREYLEQGGK